jgi:hypothetical protein
MQLEEFILRREVVLSKKVVSLCNKGVDLARISLDPNHNEEHLFRIFSDLDRFLEEESQAQDVGLDFETLLLAICWHDVWRFTKPQTANKVILLLEYLWEAKGSIRKSKKMAQKVGLSKKLTDSVAYTIGKHAGWQPLSPKTTEAKIRGKILSSRQN